MEVPIGRFLFEASLPFIDHPEAAETPQEWPILQPSPLQPIPRSKLHRERPSPQGHGLLQERFGAVAFATLFIVVDEGMAGIQMLGMLLQ